MKYIEDVRCTYEALQDDGITLGLTAEEIILSPGIVVIRKDYPSMTHIDIYLLHPESIIAPQWEIIKGTIKNSHIMEVTIPVSKATENPFEIFLNGKKGLGRWGPCPETLKNND